MFKSWVVVLVVCVMTLFPVVARCDLPVPVVTALKYMAHEHDKYHKAFIVFSDTGSAGNTFFASGWMGDLVPTGVPEPGWVGTVVDERCVTNPVAGTTSCLKFTYPAVVARTGSNQWVALSLQGPPTQEGVDDHRSYDLGRYAVADETIELQWQARGATGNERIEFKRFPTDSQQVPTPLTTKWQSYSLKIAPRELGQPLHELFVWATNSTQNPGGCTFFVDEIRVVFGPQGTRRRLAEPRFIPSYVTLPQDVPDQYFREVAFVYDQALAISALVATGRPDDLARARLIGDALVYAVENDRARQLQADDPTVWHGRIRNAYRAGNLVDLGNAPLPGWWDAQKKVWYEEKYCVGSDVGNASWAMIGLLNLHEATGSPANSPYLRTAIALGDWIEAEAKASDVGGGFTGGWEGWERTGASPGQTRSPWKSTEHAIDCYAAFTRLTVADPAQSQRWQGLAQHADRFVKSMWNARAHHLFTGTGPDGVTANPTPKPLDVQVWSLLAYEDVKRFQPAVEWALSNCRVPLGKGQAGYDFDTDRDGVWFEGCGQMALALKALGRNQDARNLLDAIQQHGVVREKGTGEGAVYAASKDRLTTGFSKVWTDGAPAEPWVYYHRPHLGATAWYIFAELGWNPYTGRSIRQ